MKKPADTKEAALRRKNAELRARLAEAEETLEAIRTGVVDAVVVSGKQGEQVYTLESAESAYRVVVETMNEGAATLVAGHSLLYCNARFAVLLKKPLEMLIGSSLRPYVTPGDLAAFDALVAAGAKEFSRGEITFQREDGTAVPVQLSCSALDLHGERGVCVVASDLTERKLAEAALRRSHEELEAKVRERTAALTSACDALATREALLRAVMDGSPDPIYVKDRDSRILMANPALAEAVGRPLSQIIGKTDAEYYGDAVAGKALREHDLRVMASGKPEVTEETVPTPRGPRTFLSSKAPYRDAAGEIIGVLGISHEITERKQAEERLEQTSQELARSNRDLEQFASIASHDMQEPLRAVKGYLGLLKRRLGESLDPKAQEILAFAMDGASRMEKMTGDLLAFSRVTTHGGAFAPANLSGLLSDVLQNLGTTIKTSGAAVTSDPLPFLSVDAQQITRLFQNLIGNAIKFRGERPPRIHIGARQQPGRWEFWVRDNGIGISAEHFDRIFQIFQRLHTQTQYPGTGIGLAVCKRIVERHGGAIRVESTPGEGSTFHFWIPANLGEGTT